MSVERVAVIGGTGEEGFGLAVRWGTAGIEVIIGSRDRDRARAAAARAVDAVPGVNVHGLLNQEAAAGSDLVVVAVPFAGQAAIYKAIRDHVRDGAVIVDCTVPLAAEVGGRATHVLGVWQGSAAQQAAGLLRAGGRTGKVRLCAAFHSLPAAGLNDFGRPMDGDVLVCGGDHDAKSVVGELVRAIPDLRFVDAGPLDTARIVEPLTALLVGLNRRYQTDRAGIKITGLPAARPDPGK